ncbi:MAG: DUF3817 domain-containing protein [Mariniblastus sp.]
MKSTPQTNSKINQSFLRKLSWMGLIEGTSTLILFFVAMPLKYMAEMPIAVEIAGSIHGGLFVCLIAMLVIAVWRIPISIGMSLVGMVSAVIPFGPFVYERWLRRLSLEQTGDNNT